MAKVKVEMKGLERVTESLRNLNKKFVYTESVIEFTAHYATRIHEDLEMPHSNGQAKFLEIAIREAQPNLAGNVRDLMRTPSVTLPEAMLIINERTLTRAKELVPVDTGFLRNSGRVTVRSSIMR